MPLSCVLIFTHNLHFVWKMCLLASHTNILVTFFVILVYAFGRFLYRKTFYHYISLVLLSNRNSVLVLNICIYWICQPCNLCHMLIENNDGQSCKKGLMSVCVACLYCRANFWFSFVNDYWVVRRCG